MMLHVHGVRAHRLLAPKPPRRARRSGKHQLHSSTPQAALLLLLLLLLEMAAAASMLRQLQQPAFSSPACFLARPLKQLLSWGVPLLVLLFLHRRQQKLAPSATTHPPLCPACASLPTLPQLLPPLQLPSLLPSLPLLLQLLGRQSAVSQLHRPPPQR